MRFPLLILLAGCSQPLLGDGQLVDDDRSLVGFTAVETYGVNARVALGETDGVVINTDQNLQDSVLTTVEDGLLRIEVIGELYPTSMTALVVVADLEAAGNFDGADLWVSGLDGEALDITASGDGSTELSGAVDVLTMTSAGPGVRNTSELDAADVVISMTGAGTGWMTATDSITGDVSSASTLNVFGDPEQRAVTADSASEVVYY